METSFLISLYSIESTITWLLHVNSLTNFGCLKGLLRQICWCMSVVNVQNGIFAENLTSAKKNLDISTPAHFQTDFPAQIVVLSCSCEKWKNSNHSSSLTSTHSWPTVSESQTKPRTFIEFTFILKLKKKTFLCLNGKNIK